MNHHLISLMVFVPVIGAIVQALVPRDPRLGNRLSSWITLGASLASSLCGIFLVLSMQTATADLQYLESFPWVGSFAISYVMGIDGLNVLPVLLISIIFPLLIASEWNRGRGAGGIHGLFLILQASLVGAVCAQDLFLLFFFWGLSTLPLYFLIGIWGGKDRETAAFRTIVTGSIGNALFFAAMVLIYHAVEPHTFLIQELSGGRFAQQNFNFLGSDFSVAQVAFGLICAGLALRMPIWPVHGWFTKDAEEAPASVFVALSAAMVPVGMYIFLRLAYSIFPETVSAAAPGIVVVGVVNLVIGGICAITQRKLKLLLAFIVLGQIGFVLIGIGSLNAAGLVGAIYQCLSLGLAVAAFGLFVGLLFARGGKPEFCNEEGEVNYGGVAVQAPFMAVVAGTAVSSLLGFPGVGGFVGNALMIVGGYSVHPAVVAIVLLALLLATYYLFTMYRYVFLGAINEKGPKIEDLTLWERGYLFPLVASLLFLGMYPKPLIELVRPTVLTILSTIKK